MSQPLPDLTNHAPEDVLRWAWDRFAPDVALSSSFQPQSLPLLHMVSRAVPEMPVLFIDTGFHFPETLRFRDELAEAWGLNVRVVAAAPQDRRPGLYSKDPDACCWVHKIEPMERATRGLRAWISGIRRDQTNERKSARVLEQEGPLVRVHPLLGWSARDVWAYIDEHALPSHPLFAQGYLSIGCAPCTRPVQAGADERSGRWAGRDKTECGLHTQLRPPRTGSL